MVSRRPDERTRRWALAAALCLFSSPMLAGCPHGSCPNHQKDLTVFAAASTADLLPKIVNAYERAYPHSKVRLSFGASSMLARQILAGAPADVFLSANERWMDALEAKGRLRPKTRIDVLANHLVVVAPKTSTWTVTLRPGVDLARAAGGRVALADPAHVPAGLYARRTFEALHSWAALEPHVIAAQDVRAALRIVEMGEAPAGVVYETDARASDRIRVLARVPSRLSGRIRYPAAAIAGGAEEAARFVRFLRTDTAREQIEQSGFFSPPPAQAGRRAPSPGSKHAPPKAPPEPPAHPPSSKRAAPDAPGPP